MIILSISIAAIVLFIGLVIWQWNYISYVRTLKAHLQSINIQKQEQEDRFNSLFDHTDLGIAFFDLQGCFFKVNSALCHLTGYAEIDLIEHNFYHLFYKKNLADIDYRLQELLNKKISSLQSKLRFVKKSKEITWIFITLTLLSNADGNPSYFMLQVQDISLQEKAEKKLQHLAYHDALTGLANRNKLEQFIHHILALARRHQERFGLLFLDLDRFKDVNDTIGHEAGDTILQIVADRLINTVRSSDMVARFGGDEFVLLIADIKNEESVAVIAQKVLDNILRVMKIKGKEIYLSLSIGISLYPDNGQTIQTLIQNADLALYKAKEKGRNNYQFYTAEMTKRAYEKAALKYAVSQASVKKEFLLYYQPKMEINTRLITGIEVLLRWENKEYNITSNEIFHLTDESGLIIPLGKWVLKSATHQLKIWHDMGFDFLTLGINCSARQFKQPHFISDFLKIIYEENVPVNLIELQLSEETIFQDTENIIHTLHLIKQAGIQITINHFGKGHWSFSYMENLNIDNIKIDKSFIKNILDNNHAAQITSAITAMAHKLNIKTIAEDVETRAQYELIEKIGCDEIQGYYLTQPLNDIAMTHFLKHPVPDAETISKENYI